MLVLSVQGDVSEISKALTRTQRKEIPFAMVVSLTRTAYYTRGALQKEIARAFDRPTTSTLNAFWVDRATKQKPTAMIRVKEEAAKGNPQVRYLLPEIEGGARKQKGFEKLLDRAGVMPTGWYAIPASGAKLDAYGNVTGATINRILSQLQASRDPLVRETVKLKKRRNRTARKGRYFVAYPGNERTAHLKPGIYERLGTAWGSGVRPVFIYSSRAPRYRRRFRFYEIAEQTAKMRWRIEFGLAMREALRAA